MRQHTWSGWFHGWQAESTVALVRWEGEGTELPDIPDGTEVTVTWEESEPTDVLERVMGRVRDRVQTSSVLWSNGEVVDAMVRELDDAGYQITPKR